MKVQVLFTGSYPQGEVTTHRVHNICKGLVANGADVELLLIKPTEKVEAVRNPDSMGFFEGVRYQYVRGRNLRSSNFLKRRWDDFLSALFTFFQLMRNKSGSDVVIVIGPSFDSRLIFPLATKLSATKIALEINEYPFVNQSNSWLTGLKQLVLFRVVFPLYDGFIVISGGLAKLVERYKTSRAVVIKIPVLADLPPALSGGDPPVDEPYVIHAGSISEEKDGMSGILRAFAYAKVRLSYPIKLVVTGNAKQAPGYESIERLIRELGVEDNVIFTGFLSRKELGAYFRHATLAIINKLNTKQNRYCFPTKLADYTSYGVPVITTDVGEIGYFIEDGVNAYIVEPGNPSLLGEQLASAFDQKNRRTAIGEAGRATFNQEFNTETHGKRLYKFLDEKMICDS